MHPMTEDSMQSFNETFCISPSGIMNHTKSTQGSALLKEWFLRPSTDIHLLRQRQEAIAYLISPTNIESVSALKDALKNTKNIMVCFRSMIYSKWN